MAKDYDYQILDYKEVALLDNYNSNLREFKMSEVMDEILNVIRNHVFGYLTVTYDAVIGRDLDVTRNLTCLTLEVGGGYGTTGVSIDEDGNLTADGVGDFMASGIMTVDETPANAAAAGDKGMVTYDDSYIYVCTDTNTWMRGAIATW